MPSPPVLNERQKTILALVAEGKTNQQIADQLHLAENTIKWYLQQIFQELDAQNRVEAVRIARRQGLLPRSPTASIPQDNLPAATTPFLGREDRLHELKELILQPQPRLISICGLGGVGKTRLAIETARLVADQFTDGVFFIPLETVETAGRFWSEFVTHLNIPRLSSTPERQLAREYLHNRQALLVLDNTEYLPFFQSEISWLLTQTKYLQVVSTSRVRLNLHAEYFYPLDGLGHQNGIESPAYRLFHQVSQRHRHRFQPDQAEQADIIAFCQYVEGMPLAIELAASWMDVLEPGQLLTQLTHSLGKIEHDVPDRPARQRSLEAVIAYSWQFLTDEERMALMRLSSLCGSFTREAALVIAGCSPGILKKLMHGSLVQSMADGRLKIHELIRRFSLEQVNKSGLDLDHILDRHMDYYLNWLAVESTELRKTLSAVIIHRIRDEWHQVEAAWHRAVERQCWDLLESCIDLVMYFEGRRAWGEGMAFFQQTQNDLPADCRRLSARLDEGMSIFAIRMYDLSLAEKLAHRALEILGPPEKKLAGQGNYALITLTTITYVTGGYAAYSDYLADLSQVTDNYLEEYNEISSSMFAGIYHCAAQQYAQGVHSFLDTIAISNEQAYYLPAIRCMLGLAYIGMTEYDAAREQFNQALEKGLAFEVYPAIFTALYELDRLDYPQKSITERMHTMLLLVPQLASEQTIGRVAINIGANYLQMGFYRRAREMFRIGLRLLRHISNTAEWLSYSRIVSKFLLYELAHRRIIARSKALQPSSE